MAINLYQFAISHFCEKVRWALDYKGVSYQPVSLLPGNHIKTIRQLTGSRDTSVPVLVHDDTVVQGSAAIIDYLDETFPGHPLTPTDPQARKTALTWEKRLDEEIGPAVRCYSYHHFLKRPKVVVPLLAAGTPFYNRILLSLTFSRVEELMREWLKINDKTAERSRQTMEAAITDLATAYERSPFLAGDQFSRADLTAAAIFSPMFQPDQYPVPWPKPEKIPADIRTWLAQWRPRMAVLERIYQANR